ncbi:MAG: histidinol-phosphatase HisJ family protein [Desulfovibrionaceae bacterium]|nr:histidinol-phosphatase HisJ family protein [Desulfovibrionaceae bacterium]
MIQADLHNHTWYSHGAATTADMYAAAQKTDLELFGFSEHSPLPPGYACGLYRHGDLSGVFPEYAREVMALRRTAVRPRVLFGMELDWIPARRDFMEKLVSAYPFDYIIGAIHYLGTFSIGSGNWSDGEAACFARYDAYYDEMARMAASGMVDVVAHPDFIKLHSFECFHRWLTKPESLRRVRRALEAMAKAGTAMEISSAGLRRPWHEAHPAPAILPLAAAAGVRISFGSDSHGTDSIAGDFASLAEAARAHGFHEYLIFEQRRPRALPL